jgi:hypothetical protein
MSGILSIEPGGNSIPVFRIYVEATAESYDVRLDGRGVPYVLREGIIVVTVDNTPAANPTAYDRVDDR